MARTRLQKIIAAAGLASRRTAEQWIAAGRVRVNGRVVRQQGVQADPYHDRIEVDGRKVVAEPLAYVVLHKPRNVVATMSDPEDRPTVADYVAQVGVRLYPVGRLDFSTSGVLLMTNDGQFANGLLHPRHHVDKIYVVKVNGLMNDRDLARWAKGVELDDGPTLPAKVKLLRHEDNDKSWLEVTLREGRNQQIRRMGEATGFTVMRLARINFAGITHDRLRPGQWRALTVDELKKLKKAYGVPNRIRPPRDLSERRAKTPQNQGPGKRSHRSKSPERGRPAKRPEGTTRSSERGSKGRCPSRQGGDVSRKRSRNR